jgi:cupin fold WbuC family metalloprotein
MTVLQFTPEYIGSLVDEAAQSERMRCHRNIHKSYQDPCQRFLNAIGVDSYIRPHRHMLDPKAETLVAIQGLLALVIFDESGTVASVVKIGAERYWGEGDVVAGVDLTPGVWHTIIALTSDAVLMELKGGPFNPDAAKEPAPWAPEEGTSQAIVYIASLKQIVSGAE